LCVELEANYELFIKLSPFSNDIIFPYTLNYLLPFSLLYVSHAVARLLFVDFNKSLSPVLIVAMFVVVDVADTDDHVVPSSVE
jgi:hypothetical protein